MLGHLVHVDTDAGCHVSEIGDTTETAAQVTPNWVKSSNAENNRVHESEDIEGHLLAEEGVGVCDRVRFERTAAWWDTSVLFFVS